jgi:hypothetical protein
MEGLIRIWLHASIKASKRLSNREVGNNKSEKARIDRAMRLLRKGSVSKATKAMESNELGDLNDAELIQKMQDKHPVRIKQIGPDIYTFVTEEEVELKVDTILGKLSNEAASRMAGLRNTHVMMWMVAFAPESAETTIEHLDDFIPHMANDMLPPWSMQAMHGAYMLAIVKVGARAGRKADHMPVVVPNTLSKIADTAMMEECKEKYTRDLMPQQLMEGVEFAAELLAM